MPMATGMKILPVPTEGVVGPGGAATQSDPWDVADTLKVGAFGNGTLNVEDGSVVNKT